MDSDIDYDGSDNGCEENCYNDSDIYHSCIGDDDDRYHDTEIPEQQLDDEEIREEDSGHEYEGENVQELEVEEQEIEPDLDFQQQEDLQQELDQSAAEQTYHDTHPDEYLDYLDSVAEAETAPQQERLVEMALYMESYQEPYADFPDYDPYSYSDRECGVNAWSDDEFDQEDLAEAWDDDHYDDCEYEPYIPCRPPPSRPPPEEDPLHIDAACITCYNNVANTVLIPCGHLVLCSDCCDHIGFKEKEMLGAGRERCPICRVVVQDRMMVYR